ncbi:uncharacterized protein LOC114731221 [Neltuma alba]|uniref:uncharacterized protein LOC114731221 n=1 Tax=Neltuma alba TaxID=207710 RepID=UPI0010A59E1E|nr:uncharacterized protein LOC114731221 [Prosopis alba]
MDEEFDDEIPAVLNLTTNSVLLVAAISQFRLRYDPLDCGHPDYELTCENDVPLIHVSNGTYRVLGINYKNFTIRLVDADIQKGNCSSLPFYSLSLFDFDNGNSRNPYRAYVVHGNKTESVLCDQVGYMKCSDAVREDGAYVDAAHCVKEGGHLYAVVSKQEATRNNTP